MNESVDIIVVGAGAAGIAAAVTAARAGRTTLLMDRRPAAGGTGGFSGLTTLCGLYDDAGRFLDEGFPAEFARAVGEVPPARMGRVWVLLYRPDRFVAVASSLIGEMKTLQSCWNTPLANVRTDGDRVAGVNGVRAGAVIDCSGTAEVARAAGAECLETDEATQAPAMLISLRNVTCRLDSAASMAQALLPVARAGLPVPSLQPGLEPNAVTAKFTGRLDEVGGTIDFLRKNVGGFENCQAPEGGFIPAQRAGRMVIGRHVLTGADVLEGRRFPDAVARCAWPIEQWNAEGVARFRYLPPGACYEIPARSLRAARLKNLFMAGKTISADVDAIASARVMGCCLATGAAAGRLAVNYLESTPAS